MRICTIGGTEFSGRAFTGLALGAGHEVTVFHRGRGSEDPWPDAGHVHGDRDEDLGLLAGRVFDVVADFCAYVPRHVQQLVEALPDAGRYLLISSMSAHREDARAGATEEDDVHQPPFPQTEEITWETYGPLKVACEQAIRAARGEAAVVVGAPRRGGGPPPPPAGAPPRPDRPVHVLGAPRGGGGTHGRAGSARAAAAVDRCA
jgi:2'-hydroxyisoflavone reductase